MALALVMTMAVLRKSDSEGNDRPGNQLWDVPRVELDLGCTFFGYVMIHRNQQNHVSLNGLHSNEM